MIFTLAGRAAGWHSHVPYQDAMGGRCCVTVEGRVFLELNNPTDVARIESALKGFPNE